ncbi:MAG TPA: AtpZ/AtpI family protein [Candidatus Kapabacteria bacterium]|nr:AtpZ/AtpI family protein [Candidatus Kapabacteria bacterium]
MLNNFNKQTRAITNSSKYLSLGIEVFLPAVLGTLIGHYWLDEPQKTPIWTISLALLGFLIGMYKLFKTVLQINKKNKHNDNHKYNNSNNS